MTSLGSAAHVASRSGARTMRDKSAHEKITDVLEVETGASARCRALCGKIKAIAMMADFSDSKMDPYIKIALMPWRTMANTKTIQDQDDEKDAVWSEDLNVLLPEDADTDYSTDLSLVVQAWDDDMGQDDLIGQGSLEAEQVKSAMDAPNTSIPFVVELQNAEDESCGDVNMSLTFQPAHPDLVVPNQVKGDWQGPSRGNLCVRIENAAGLTNPAKAISSTADDPRLIVGGVLLAFCYFGCGALVFGNTCTTMVEGDDGVSTEQSWTLVDSLYFSIVTITTTGYGDLLPNTDGAKLFACFYAYFGVGIIAAVMGFLIAIMVEKHAQGKFVDKMKQAGKAAASKAAAGASKALSIRNPKKEHELKILCLTIDKRNIPWKHIKAGASLLIFKFTGGIYFTNFDGALVTCNAWGMGSAFGGDVLMPQANQTNPAGSIFALGAGNAKYDKYASEFSTLTATAAMKTWHVASAADVAARTTDGAGLACDCNAMFKPTTAETPVQLAVRRDAFFGAGTCYITDKDGSHGLKHQMKSLTDSLYMSCVTMTSIGYGEFSPQNKNARIFAIFWILGGTLLVGNFMGGLVDDYMSAKQNRMNKKMLNRNFTLDDMRKLDKDGDGSVTEVEFFTYMVSKMGKADKIELQELRNRFKEIDASGDGFITKEDLEMVHQKHMDKAEAQAESEAQEQGRKLSNAIPLAAVADIPVA